MVKRWPPGAVELIPTADIAKPSDNKLAEKLLGTAGSVGIGNCDSYPPNGWKRP